MEKPCSLIPYRFYSLMRSIFILNCLISTLMSPRSVLVTGANRGIGLGLVKEFLKDEAIEVVIATGRNTLMVNQLTEIDDSRLKLIELDVDDDDSIQEAYGEVCEFLSFLYL